LGCERCGSTTETRHSDAVGAVLCESCYCKLPSARYRPPTEPIVKLQPPPPFKRPGWVKHRMKVIELMVRDGSFVYIDQDCCAGICPRCNSVMFVEFIGRTEETDLQCVGGCAPLDIVAALGTRNGQGDQR
jgi:hypothetical protein